MKDPVQFNFAQNWPKILDLIEAKPTISRAFENLLLYYEDILESKYEGTAEPQVAIAKDLEAARTRVRDLKWLRETFDGISLIKPVIEIAQVIYPSLKFEVFENYGLMDRAVITDSKRTIVFDIAHFDRLSAKASLVYSGDIYFMGDTEALVEVTKFMGKNIKKEKQVIKRIRALLRQANDTDYEGIEF